LTRFGRFPTIAGFIMAQPLTHPAFAPLKAAFPDVKFVASQFRDMTTLVVPRERIVDVSRLLHDDPATRYDFLAELNGVDYLGYVGSPGRFAVNYGLTSTINNNRLWLRVYVSPERETTPGVDVRDEDAVTKGDPGLMVPSVTGVWAGAEWMERETYDLLGIIFTGHPDLRRIMTWNGFGSHPLRKDYPLRGIGERDDYKIVTRDSA
jgi:NADH-quinone oxidoreductase subunit C